MQLQDKVTLSDTSTEAASMASHRGRLYISWKGVGNNDLNVMYSADGGRTFSHKLTSTETSLHTPELCVHDQHLYISWIGVGNNELNVARIEGD